MLTMTTYGTWLRGDRRGWVDDGRVLPADAAREDVDRRRMTHPPFRFASHELRQVGEAMGTALVERLDLAVLALCVQRWHAHVVIGVTRCDVGSVVRCAKEAARYALRPGRPIWSGGYDKRFCFDATSVQTRVRYVERHNEQLGWSQRPWSFVTDVDAYLRAM